MMMRETMIIGMMIGNEVQSDVHMIHYEVKYFGTCTLRYDITLRYLEIL